MQSVRRDLRYDIIFYCETFLRLTTFYDTYDTLHFYDNFMVKYSKWRNYTKTQSGFTGSSVFWSEKGEGKVKRKGIKKGKRETARNGMKEKGKETDRRKKGEKEGNWEKPGDKKNL